MRTIFAKIVRTLPISLPLDFSGVCRCPNMDIRCDVVQTNKPGTGAYRAPAGPQAYFALESTVQELCQQLGMDPLLIINSS